MKISRSWLQTFFKDPLPEAKTLADALTFHAFEIESIENDVLDVKVTPNRGHDCLSHRGIAKELSAILKLPLMSDPLRAQPRLEPISNSISVALESPALSPRYIAAYIRGVHVGPSPAWLRDSLEAIGQRSINNVVDATNYIMFHVGQPLHAFDAGQLRAREGTYAIAVRHARVGEKMLALDDKEYDLTDSMLVIADEHADVAIGIAGVKGGKPAGISEVTKDIIIESANFDGVSVRRTAAALRLRTDASSRFEQVIAPELAGEGMRAVVDLILNVAAGKLEGFVDAYPVAQTRATVSFTTERVNALLGTSLGEKDVVDVLTRLDLAHTSTGSEFQVHAPFERLDLVIPEDLVEEVGRIIGYDSVPTQPLPPLAEKPVVNRFFYLAERIREFLIERGFSEVYTSVFAEEGERAVANKVDSVRPFLRRDLLASVRDALERNQRNKDLLGERQVRIFEIGTRWKDGKESRVLALGVEKIKKAETAADVADVLVKHLGVSLGEIGAGEEVIELPLEDMAEAFQLPSAYDELPSSEASRYEPYSRYPFIVRDVAFWTPSGTDAADVAELVRERAGELAKRIDLFDRFEKEGRVSLAFRIVFQSFDKTLTDFEASERMESIYAGLKEKGYEIR